MSDDTARELAACLAYAAVVSRVLPIDHEAERAVSLALQKRSSRYVGRKLTRKVTP